MCFLVRTNVALQVYYCGGIDALNTFTYDTCYQYDPTADSWSNSSEVPPMPRGMNHAAACTDGEKMYVFGGRMGYNDVLEGFDDTQVLLLSLAAVRSHWHLDSLVVEGNCNSRGYRHW